MVLWKLPSKHIVTGMHPVITVTHYEIDEHALVITFQYPAEGGDAMYPLLETLRKSIKIQ